MSQTTGRNESHGAKMTPAAAMQKLNLSESAVNKLVDVGILRLVSGEIRSADVSAVLCSNALLARCSKLRKQDAIDKLAAEQALVAAETKRESLYKKTY